MSRTFTALATSVDGFITGPDPSPERALGLGGERLFGWYTSGDVPSAQFSGFRLWPASASVFDDLAARVGAVIAGRRTYDHSHGWNGRGPHPTAPLVVLSHRPAPDEAGAQTFARSIVDAVAVASRLAGDRDVAIMGGGAMAAALHAGLLDEVIVHQVPVLLGGGVPLFQQSPPAVELTRVEAVVAPDVTHLRYAVAR